MGKLHHHSPPAQHLRLSNKFSILNEQDFPPLIDHRVSPPSVNPSSHLSPPPFTAPPGGNGPLLLVLVPYNLLLTPVTPPTSPRGKNTTSSRPMISNYSLLHRSSRSSSPGMSRLLAAPGNAPAPEPWKSPNKQFWTTTARLCS